VNDTGLLLADLQWSEVNYKHQTRRLLAARNEDVPALQAEALRAWHEWEAAKARYDKVNWNAKRARALIDLMCHAPRFRMDP
jgi:hypothetical protein